MNVKPETLYKIKCSNCSKYLSRGPVWQLRNGNSICGRCPQARTGSSSRSTDYENIVRDLGLLFPCSNDGCPEKHLFVDMNSHEAECKYQKYKCVFAQMSDNLYRGSDTDSETTSCNWQGEKTNLYLHCQENHPDAIIQNNTLLVLNEKDGLNIYMMNTLNVFFVIYIQVSKADNVINFCVKATDTENTYVYNLTLNRTFPFKNLPVHTNNNLDFQPHQAIHINYFKHIPIVRFSITNYQIKCENMNCTSGMDITKQEAYLLNSGWQCNDCIQGKNHCKYTIKGCAVEDLPAKIETQCSFFCPHSCVCNICKARMGKLILQHYIDMHDDAIYLAGKMFTTDVCKNWSVVLVDTDDIMGMLYCRHRLFGNQFELKIDSKIASGRLHLYTCMIEIMNPNTTYRIQKIAEIQPLDVEYQTYCDWKIVIKRAPFLECVFADKFLLKISLTAKQFPCNITLKNQRKRCISYSDSD